MRYTLLIRHTLLIFLSLIVLTACLQQPEEKLHEGASYGNIPAIPLADSILQRMKEFTKKLGYVTSYDKGTLICSFSSDSLPANIILHRKQVIEDKATVITKELYQGKHSFEDFGINRMLIREHCMEFGLANESVTIEYTYNQPYFLVNNGSNF